MHTGEDLIRNLENDFLAIDIRVALEDIRAAAIVSEVQNIKTKHLQNRILAKNDMP